MTEVNIHNIRQVVHVRVNTQRNTKESRPVSIVFFRWRSSTSAGKVEVHTTAPEVKGTLSRRDEEILKRLHKACSPKLSPRVSSSSHQIITSLSVLDVFKLKEA
jgi:hypothetical protein